MKNKILLPTSVCKHRHSFCDRYFRVKNKAKNCDQKNSGFLGNDLLMIRSFPNREMMFPRETEAIEII